MTSNTKRDLDALKARLSKKAEASTPSLKARTLEIPEGYVGLAIDVTTDEPDSGSLEWDWDQGRGADDWTVDGLRFTDSEGNSTLHLWLYKHGRESKIDFINYDACLCELEQWRDEQAKHPDDPTAQGAVEAFNMAIRFLKKACRVRDDD